MLAIEVERRLKLKRTQRHRETDTTMSDVDETLIRGAVDFSTLNYDTSAAIDSLIDDNAPTLKEDEAVENGQIIENVCHSDEANVDDKPKASDVVPLSLTIQPISNDFEDGNLSPSFSLHSSPSLGALDESRNQSLYFTPMSGRELFSPQPKQMDQFPSARLIRSNSYTLDKPSPMLLKHMEQKGIYPNNSTDSPVKNPMSLNEFRKNQINASNCTPRKSLLQPTTYKTSAKKVAMSSSNNSLNALAIKQSNKSNSTKSNKVQNESKRKQSKQAGQTGIFKNSERMLRSIYGSNKSNPVQNKTVSSNSSLDSNKTPMKLSNVSTPNIETNLLNTSNGKINTQSYIDILAMIENQHKTQMETLLRRQREEQKRMQDDFLNQQKELLKKIECLVANKNVKPNGSEQSAENAKKSNEKMLIDEVSIDVPVVYDSNGNRLKRFTPENVKCSRRLCYDDNKLDLNKNDIDKLSLSSLSTATSELNDRYTVQEIHAVSTIAAYVRGYLVRRIIKTKKVQDLKKTHSDTLDLLLNICTEKNENETKTDIEFKYHLLQQVMFRRTPDYIQLHSIFFIHCQLITASFKM